MTDATTTEAPAPAKTRKRTSYEDAGVHELRQPNGDSYLNDRGRFQIGHDAKLKRDLVLMVLDGDKAPQITRNGIALTATEAEALLGALRWTSHLDASRTARQGKAAKQAAKAADKAKAEAAQPSADRLEQAKAAKAAATRYVDQTVRVPVEGKRGRHLGKVIRVFRADEDDILSAYQAEVLVSDDPQDPDSPTTLVTVSVADLKTA